MLYLAKSTTKPHIVYQGIPITIENPDGSFRRWHDPFNETSGKTKMDGVHYGEIPNSPGLDGDPLDVFLGPLLNAPTAYLIMIRKPPDFTEEDEIKCFLGFRNPDHAVSSFLLHYNDPRFVGGIKAMSVDELRAKAANGEVIKSLQEEGFCKARRVPERREERPAVKPLEEQLRALPVSVETEKPNVVKALFMLCFDLIKGITERHAHMRRVGAKIVPVEEHQLHYKNAQFNLFAPSAIQHGPKKQAATRKELPIRGEQLSLFNRVKAALGMEEKPAPQEPAKKEEQKEGLPAGISATTVDGVFVKKLNNGTRVYARLMKEGDYAAATYANRTQARAMADKLTEQGLVADLYQSPYSRAFLVKIADVPQNTGEKETVEKPEVKPETEPHEKKEPWEMTAIDYATRHSSRMQELRDKKPRPLDKLYGKQGPTEEQAAEHAQSMKEWNSEYRKESKAHEAYLADQGQHKRSVEQAIADGKPVSETVRGHYPDLQPKTKEEAAVSDVTREPTERARVFQVDEKERLAEKHGKPLNAYYDLSYAEWKGVRDKDASEGGMQEKKPELPATVKAPLLQALYVTHTLDDARKTDATMGGGGRYEWEAYQSKREKIDAANTLIAKIEGKAKELGMQGLIDKLYDAVGRPGVLSEQAKKYGAPVETKEERTVGENALHSLQPGDKIKHKYGQVVAFVGYGGLLGGMDVQGAGKSPFHVDPEHYADWRKVEGEAVTPKLPAPTLESVGKEEPAPSAPVQPKETLPSAAHRYGLTNRPPGIGAIPKGYTSYEAKHSDFRHGVITYDHPLTADEISSYELTPFLDTEEQKEQAAQHIIEQMGENGPEYVKPENDKYLHDFIDRNQREVGHIDTADLYQRVRAKLEGAAPKQETQAAEASPTINHKAWFDLGDRVNTALATLDPSRSTLQPSPSTLRQIARDMNISEADVRAAHSVYHAPDPRTEAQAKGRQSPTLPKDSEVESHAGVQRASEFGYKGPAAQKWTVDGSVLGNTPTEALAAHQAAQTERADAAHTTATIETVKQKIHDGSYTDKDLQSIAQSGKTVVSGQHATGILTQLGLRPVDAQRAVQAATKEGLNANGEQTHGLRNVIESARTQGHFSTPSQTTPASKGHFIRNHETQKVELHFDKKDYQALSPEDKQSIKSAFLWSPTAGGWVSRGKIGGNLWSAEQVIKKLGLEDKGAEGEKLSFEEQKQREVERASNRADRLLVAADRREQEATHLQADFNSKRGDIAYLTQPFTNNSGGRAFKRQVERTLGKYERGFEKQNEAREFRHRAENAESTANREQERNPGYLQNRIDEAAAEMRDIDRHIEKYPEPEHEEYRNRLQERRADMLDRHTYYSARMKNLQAEGIGGHSKATIKAGDFVTIGKTKQFVVRASDKTVSVQGKFLPWPLQYKYAEIQEHHPAASDEERKARLKQYKDKSQESRVKSAETGQPIDKVTSAITEEGFTKKSLSFVRDRLVA